MQSGLQKDLLLLEIGIKKKTKRGGRVQAAKKRARLEKEALKRKQHGKDMETMSEGVFTILNTIIGELPETPPCTEE